MTTTVKNPNWPEANQLTITSPAGKLNQGLLGTTFNKWSEQVLNPESPDLKASALTKWANTANTINSVGKKFTRLNRDFNLSKTIQNIHIDHSSLGLFRAIKHNQRKDRTEQQQQLIRIPTGQRQTAWLSMSAAAKLNQKLPESIQVVVRKGLEREISESQGKRPNHWAALPPHNSRS